jgi:hypothetical protein
MMCDVMRCELVDLTLDVSREGDVMCGVMNCGTVEKQSHLKEGVGDE